MRRVALFFLCWIILAGLPMKTRAAEPVLETWQGPGFRIQKPQGWLVLVSGQCSDLGFLVYDPANPARQFFFFGSVGPFYMSWDQKQLDQQVAGYYQGMLNWLDMPVVVPLTPENFFRNFEGMARSSLARQYVPHFPPLQGLEPVWSVPLPNMVQGGQTGLVRGLFRQGNVLAEGLFQATVAPFAPFTGSPGGGTGVGMLVMGVSAAKDEFAYWQPVLTRCLGSFDVSAEYAAQCQQASGQAWGAVASAGRTLSETSDMIMQGWESRNRSYDIMAEKRSDAILGRDRVYNPETDEVYEVDPQFWEHYDINRQQYRQKELERLPENDHRLWDKPPLAGDQHIRLE
ncbi:MAG: hypothetical protein AB7E32_15610 [Desulfovibrio sp.]